MARKKKFSKALTVFLAVICLAVGCLVGYVGVAMYEAQHYQSDEAPQTLVEGELQIHFLELGNKYTGDCTYIKAGETETVIPKIVGNELVFTLSGLSPVSIAYKVKETVVPVLPSTGDPSSLLAWVTLLGASGAGMKAIRRKKK